MSISVELSQNKEMAISKGSAGLEAHIGGAPITVSALMQADKTTGATLIKKSIG